MPEPLPTPSKPVSAGRWRAIALFVLTACCLFAVLLFAHTLLFSIIGAITLAIVTQPLSAWMRSRMHANVAAAVMVTLVLCVPMIFLIKHLVLQSIHLGFSGFVVGPVLVASAMPVPDHRWEEDGPAYGGDLCSDLSSYLIVDAERDLFRKRRSWGGSSGL